MQSLVGVGLLSAVVTAGQAPQFEVASIRPSPEQFERGDGGVHISGAQIRISGLSLRDYVAFAYQLPPGRVVAPEWMAQARFDIAAKIPDGVSTERIPDMLQRLLADRFLLKAHREPKEFNVYGLVVRKEGLKLAESAARPGDPDANANSGSVNVKASGSAAGLFIDFGGGSSFTLANNRVELTRVSAPDMAETFSRLLDRPVIDATGLSARYDVALTLTPEEFQGVMVRSAMNAGVVLPVAAMRALDAVATEPFSARLQPFGLQLDPRKAMLDVVVVDSMKPAPTEN